MPKHRAAPRTSWLLLGVLLAIWPHGLDAQTRRGATGSCRQSSGIAWRSLAPPDERAVLDRWCDSVGPPFVKPGAPPPPSLGSLVIATWNVHAGNGDVDALLESLEARAVATKPYGVLLLLQEAVRAGAEVPERYPDRMRPPRAIRARRSDGDVGALAERLALHVFYVPSMRNGRLFSSAVREDRGNAILSTFPLDDLRAIELPFGRQRHVVVEARVMVPGLPPLRVMSLHLDPSGHRAEEAGALATYLGELKPTGDAMVIGGDLNTWFGRREEGFNALTAALPEEPCGRAKTNTWPWRLQGPLGWWRGRLDYLFSTLPPDMARSCRTIPDQFGSDHRPVVMVIDVPVS